MLKKSQIIICSERSIKTAFVCSDKAKPPVNQDITYDGFKASSIILECGSPAKAFAQGEDYGSVNDFSLQKHFATVYG
jgi:hypothetical protein